LLGRGEVEERPDRTHLVLDFIGGEKLGEPLFLIWEVKRGMLRSPLAREAEVDVFDQGIVVCRMPLAKQPTLIVPPGRQPEKIIEAFKSVGINVNVCYRTA